MMLPDVTPADVLKQMRAFVAARKIDAAVYIYNGPDYDAIDQHFAPRFNTKKRCWSGLSMAYTGHLPTGMAGSAVLLKLMGYCYAGWRSGEVARIVAGKRPPSGAPQRHPAHLPMHGVLALAGQCRQSGHHDRHRGRAGRRRQ